MHCGLGHYEARQAVRRFGQGKADGKEGKEAALPLFKDFASLFNRRFPGETGTPAVG